DIGAREAAIAILETADVYIHLANCCLIAGSFTSVRAHLEKAYLIQEKSLAPDHFLTSYHLLASGDLAKAQGDVELARQFYTKAIKIFGETAVPQHTDWQLFKDKGTAVAP
ncbi:MAG: tetratricopeptide repeat protein, partial [Anaerolineales bacterium]|nr:tetratricopeptide repeat protein [Anaerolineales bacterium]